jgi:hypothetical protein
MSFQVSPGINVSELDLTAGTSTVSVSDAAFAGPFQWGPALQILNIASEDELVRVFGKPDDTIYTNWFSAAAFLAYSNLLRAVRVVSNTALNATANAAALSGTVIAANGSASIVANAAFVTTGLVVGQSILIGNTSATVNSITNTTAFTITSAWALATNNAATVSAFGLLIKNSDVYDTTYASGATGYGPWSSKYAGELGNTLKVSVASGANAFSSVPANGTVSLTLGSNVVTGTSTAFDTDLLVGDTLVAGSRTYTIATVTNATSAILSTSALASDTLAQGSWSRRWQYSSIFDSAPNTSNFVADRGGSKDELHIVVVDEDGAFTGVPGTVLERFPFLSKAKDVKNLNGEGNYYVDVINRTSKYIYWLAAPATSTTGWGNTDYTVTFGSDVLPQSRSLRGGQTRNSAVVDADIEAGLDLFANKDVVDISLVITGPASATVASYAIQNICELRGDCVAYVSPTFATVVNNAGHEATDIATFRNSLPSSSYGVCDSGWKYLYDKYNDKFRWVPLNGDIAGLSARADTAADPWFSPAGFTRGNIKNVVKLAWNPKQQDRDDIYKIGVNPVVSFPAQGVVLYGDKTLLSRPSAFDRINVRRLFIIIEKTIARLSRAQLFEFNDEFTRSQFRNVVEPYLRDVKARRGVIDYRVICDDSNNPPEVVEENRFVGDIYVKPSRSINFIQLNFVAVRSGVSFQEVTGV